MEENGYDLRLVSRSYPLTSLELARQLERTEALANAAMIEARRQIDPSAGADWIEVAGVYAMFDGLDSPLTQTFGLGLFDPITANELERLEQFFESRGASVAHETCPLMPFDLLPVLHQRGYRPIEYSSVLVRPVERAVEPVAGSSELDVRRIATDSIELWAQISARGWMTEAPELAGAIEDLGKVIGSSRGSSCFMAYRDDEPIAAAALFLDGSTVLLAGASTVPEHRRRGAQNALLDARLAFAAEHGAELAMMVAAPGSGSHRNAERQGFRNVYTRTKFLRDAIIRV